MDILVIGKRASITSPFEYTYKALLEAGHHVYPVLESAKSQNRS